MKLSPLLILCLLPTFKTFAQKDTLTYFFDEGLNICALKNAVIIGKGTTDQGKFKFSAAYIGTNIPLFTGSFSDSTLSFKEGMFVYYNDKGRKESEGAYENNVETGYWLIWMGDRLRDSVLYKKGEKLEQTSFFYYNGGLEKREFRNYTNNNTETTFWYIDGEKNMKSKVTTIGYATEEIRYYPSGKPRSVTQIHKTRIKSQKYYKEDGTELSKEELTEEIAAKTKTLNNIIPGANSPTYPGGHTGFFDFFARTFKRPKSLQNTGQTVTVTFYLDKAGYAKDITVTGSSDRDVEIEVMAVFRKMNAWVMNGYPAFGPITYTLNL